MDILSLTCLNNQKFDAFVDMILNQFFAHSYSFLVRLDRAIGEYPFDEYSSIYYLSEIGIKFPQKLLPINQNKFKQG